MTDPTVRIVADAISQHPCRRDEDNHTAETCPTAVAVVDALKTAGLLRQDNTVPVDRDLLIRVLTERRIWKEYEDGEMSWGYTNPEDMADAILAEARRVPDPDQEPQP